MQTDWHVVVAILEAVAVVGCLILFGLFFEFVRWLYQRGAQPPPTLITWNTGGPSVASGQAYTFIAQPFLAADNKEPEKEKPPFLAENKPEKEEELPRPKPNAYCGHCGHGIYSDPVKGLDLAGDSYVSFLCDGEDCGKKTLISQ